MPEEATTTVTTTEEPGKETETTVEDQTVPYDRFKKANAQAKEAKERATKLEREMADLKTQMEEASHAGLPELERIKADLAKAAKRAEEAEQRATEAETKAQNTQRERWVAAAAKDFIDPDDASRFVDLSDIESVEDAERAVKRVAKAKPHLLKGEEPKLPGKVLTNGRTAEKKSGDIDPDAEAQMVADSLKKFLKNRQQ